MIVYVDGRWLDESSARISIEDRGFLFADAVYEVIHVYRDHFFRMGLHMERMQSGLDTLRIPYDSTDLVPVFEQLAVRNPGSERSIIYVQVSRGVAPRVHGLPRLPHPTIVAYMNRASGQS